MTKHSSSWLKRPYPLLEDTRAKLIMVFGFGLFTFLFLLIYQPFGAAQITRYQVLILSGFGWCVALGLAFNYFLLPRLFPKIYAPENWQVNKEIGLLLFSFVVISILNYSYHVVIGPEYLPQHTLLEFFGITLSVGIFPVIIMVFLVELFQNRRNSDQAIALNEQIREADQPKKVETMVIVPETSKSLPLELSQSDFFYAVSDNNYTTIYFQQNGEVKSALLRLSIGNLSDQLKRCEDCVRCHRSYLVNKSKIVGFRGNARSLYLELEGIDEAIPVSRNFPKDELMV